jgi:hypothetical protein
MSGDPGVVSSPPAEPNRRNRKTSLTGRALALVALSGVLIGGAFLASTAYRTLTDAWIAPLRLSPDNEKVVALRVQQTKERAERARLESELAGIEAELKTVDLGLERLGALATGHGRALAWTAHTTDDEMRALRDQAVNLEGQKRLLAGLLAEQARLLDRYQADLTAGLVTATEVQRESAAVHLSEVAVQSNELQLSKIHSTLMGMERLGQALASGAHNRASRRTPIPPEVAKFADDQVRIEIEISRLEAEKRSAQARQRAARGNLEALDALLRDLETRPLYRAMQEDTDLAFVPYEHLQRFSLSDRVYACTWSIFRCSTVGTIAEIVPGEVVALDPWGALQRGQYVVLALRDHSALYARVLRVRRNETSGALSASALARARQ